jgi:hypothetical protein
MYGIEEQLLRLFILLQIPGPVLIHHEEGSIVGYPARHVPYYGDDDYRICPFSAPESTPQSCEVAIGSRAEAGSSIRITSGCTAMVLAMQRTLLLASTEAQGILLELVLYLIP